MPDDSELIVQMLAAVMRERGRVFEALEAEFPGKGAELYAIALGPTLHTADTEGMIKQLIEGTRRV